MIKINNSIVLLLRFLVAMAMTILVIPTVLITGVVEITIYGGLSQTETCATICIWWVNWISFALVNKR